jgi:hypothetical protein
MFTFVCDVVAVDPQVAMTAYVIEVVSSCMEACVCACILALQFYSDSTSTQDAMLILELALMGLQMCGTWAVVLTLMSEVWMKLRALASGEEEQQKQGTKEEEVKEEKRTPEEEARTEKLRAGEGGKEEVTAGVVDLSPSAPVAAPRPPGWSAMPSQPETG